jgi:predicted aspartyl protease
MSGATRIGLWVAASLLIGAAGIGECATAASSLPKNASGSPAVADPADAQYLVTTGRDRIGRITAPVMINGHGPFRFMIDTGSNRTVIAEATLAKLGLSSNPDEMVNVTGVVGIQRAPTTHVDSLVAGDLQFRNLDLPVLSGPVFFNVDGILGMDTFEGMKMSADFTHGRITISHSRNQRPSYSYSVIDVQFLSDRLLMANGAVGRIHVKAIIDTGGEHTLGNPALLAALNRNRHHGDPPVQTDVVGVTPLPQLGTIARTPPVQLGPIEISDLYVVFGDFQIFRTWGLQDEPALLVGMDVLGTLSNLTIDYRRKEVDFLPHATERPTLQTRWFSTNW